MQRYSFPDNTCKRLVVHPDKYADQIKHQMLAERDNVSQAVSHLENISFILCRHVRDYIWEPTGSRDIIPVFVMRGGLIMRPALERAFFKMSAGLVVPYRNSSMKQPIIVYGDVPVSSGDALYLMLDLLIATGSTMLAALESVYMSIRPIVVGDMQIIVVSPFAAFVGIQAILKRFPEVVIHTIWHQEKVDSNNRMVGPGFDIGDYALGGADVQRIQWARV